MTGATSNGAGRTVGFAVVGRLDELSPEIIGRLTDRSGEESVDLSAPVTAIIERVRRDGDAALIEMASEFDGATLDDLEIPSGQWTLALDGLEPDLRSALEQAARAIATFHEAQRPKPLTVEPVEGVRLTRTAVPLDRVGVYAPGGRAAYPSSVLMGAVPARVAGVGEVIVCSPPGADGRPSDVVLAACAIAGVDRVFAVGGAGAVAAMAFGTRSVPRVARIVGPGNAWVTEAKRQVQGRVAIDCPAGPSEILIIADDTADPAILAAELIAQAEHDPDAATVLLASEAGLAQAVRREIEVRIDGYPRETIVREAFTRRGALLVAGRAPALDFATTWAPEHLLLAIRDASGATAGIRNAGTIFVGESSSVSFGDYMTGANHVLPTGGLARSFSGLDLLDFMRWTTVQEVSPGAAAALAAPVATLAEAEGLPGHAAAARLRERPPGSSGAGPGRGVPPAGPVLREAYRSISTYDPGRSPIEVDLSDNTNLFGVCPPAAAVLADADTAVTTRYPSVYADGLVAAAASRFGVAASQVVSGCGSDDIIDSAVRAFCEPHDVVAFPWPTFGIVPTFVRMNAARPVPVMTIVGGEFDPAALRAALPRLVYVCRPNNPTGDVVPVDRLLAFAESFEGIVLVDEAYADYADDDLLADAASSRNVIVLRTLSKAWGMAGLRVGFAVGPDRLIAEIAKSRGPYKVNGLAERAGEAALREGAGWVAECVRRTRENRDRLTRTLQSRGFDVSASHANFVLVPLPAGSGDAPSVAARLRSRGVGVRPFSGLPGLEESLRVTVGPWPLMERFLDALAAELPFDGKEV